jgi:hypothetical protein
MPKKRPPTLTLELIPLLRMIAPYKVEIYDTRSGPELVLYDDQQRVKVLRVTEDIADKVAEAIGFLELLPGVFSNLNQ